MTLCWCHWNRIPFDVIISFSFTLCNVFYFALSLFLYFRQRLPPKNVYYYRCPDHRKNYVMSFAFCYDREDDIYQFAYCYPYTYTRLQHYLDNLQKRNMDYFNRERLGLSVVSNKHIYQLECVLMDAYCSRTVVAAFIISASGRMHAFVVLLSKTWHLVTS